MSKLSYRTKQAIEEAEDMLSDKKPPFIIKWLRFVHYFIVNLWYDYPHVWISDVRYMIANFRLLWPHIKHMRDWDSSYQLNLFCDSLEYLAKGLKRHNHCTNSERYYRRCLFAAKRLRTAYNDKTYEDKSYVALTKANPVRLVKCANGIGHKLTHDYSRSPEYYAKMFKIIRKRQEKVTADNKKEAWAYLNKHFESLWD